jgi:plastocyanin
MTNRFIWSLVLTAAIAGASCRQRPTPESTGAGAQSAERGTITGHVRLTATPPVNAPIRLRSDPMCDQANGGRPGTRETVIAAADGSLANVFVQLQGSLPATAVPTEPVNIEQRACTYSPHVVGARLGQIVRVRNSDPGLHNVHGVSDGSDTFNVSQPVAGMTNDFRMKAEGIVRLQCDVHGWMLAFVGVSSHPYFAVTDPAGTFEIHDVPVGSYTIQAWHELYGPLTATVQVEAGRAADVDFVYSGDEQKDAS